MKMIFLERTLYGHPLVGLLWERQFEHASLELGLGKVGDIKLVGKKQNLAPMWTN